MFDRPETSLVRGRWEGLRDWFQLPVVLHAFMQKKFSVRAGVLHYSTARRIAEEDFDYVDEVVVRYVRNTVNEECGC